MLALDMGMGKTPVMLAVRVPSPTVGFQRTRMQSLFPGWLVISKTGCPGYLKGQTNSLYMQAHSLEQHTIPCEPERHTQWTDDQLMQHQTVLVGKDVETEKEVEMFTGFKQADDVKRSIVPDGSVRFTGRGNLVVAPRTLLGQVSAALAHIPST